MSSLIEPSENSAKQTPAEIPGIGEGKDLRNFIEKELKLNPNFLPR
jgi:hypothetical protein